MDHIIHVVEDDKAVLSTVRLLLESAGWVTRGFDSAQKYLDSAGEEIPSCLVLDLRLGGMNGVELQEALKARGLELKTVIITGVPDSPLVAEAFAAGAKRLISKPFRRQELIDIVESVIGK